MLLQTVCLLRREGPLAHEVTTELYVGSEARFERRACPIKFMTIER